MTVGEVNISLVSPEGWKTGYNFGASIFFSLDYTGCSLV